MAPQQRWASSVLLSALVLIAALGVAAAMPGSSLRASSATSRHLQQQQTSSNSGGDVMIGLIGSFALCLFLIACLCSCCDEGPVAHRRAQNALRQAQYERRLAQGEVLRAEWAERHERNQRECEQCCQLIGTTVTVTAPSRLAAAASGITELVLGKGDGIDTASIGAPQLSACARAAAMALAVLALCSAACVFAAIFAPWAVAVAGDQEALLWPYSGRACFPSVAAPAAPAGCATVSVYAAFAGVAGAYVGGAASWPVSPVYPAALASALGGLSAVSPVAGAAIFLALAAQALGALAAMRTARAALAGGSHAFAREACLMANGATFLILSSAAGIYASTVTAVDAALGDAATASVLAPGLGLALAGCVLAGMAAVIVAVPAFRDAYRMRGAAGGGDAVRAPLLAIAVTSAAQARSDAAAADARAVAATASVAEAQRAAAAADARAKSAAASAEAALRASEANAERRAAMFTIAAAAVNLRADADAAAAAANRRIDQLTAMLQDTVRRAGAQRAASAPSATPQHLVREYMEMARELGREKTCPVCLDDVDAAAAFITGCGHLLCKPCIDRLRASSPAAAARCPTCRALI